MLDFVFASGSARRWNPTSRILEAHSGYCPDDRLQSDHRPVAATFDLGLGRRQALREASLERIARIEADLQRLRALVEEFD